MYFFVKLCSRFCDVLVRRFSLSGIAAVLAARLFCVAPTAFGGEQIDVIMDGNDVSASFYFVQSKYDKRSQKTTTAAEVRVASGCCDIVDNYFSRRNFIVDRSFFLQSSMWKEISRPTATSRFGPCVAANYALSKQNIASRQAFNDTIIPAFDACTLHHQVFNCSLALRLEKDNTILKSAKSSAKNKKCANNVQSQIGIQHRFGSHCSAPRAIECEYKRHNYKFTTARRSYGPKNLVFSNVSICECLKNDWSFEWQIGGNFGKKYESFATALTLRREI